MTAAQRTPDEPLVAQTFCSDGKTITYYVGDGWPLMVHATAANGLIADANGLRAEIHRQARDVSQAPAMRAALNKLVLSGKIIDRVFCPANPNKLRKADPVVVRACHDFRAALVDADSIDLIHIRPNDDHNALLADVAKLRAALERIQIQSADAQLRATYQRTALEQICARARAALQSTAGGGL